MLLCLRTVVPYKRDDIVVVSGTAKVQASIGCNFFNDLSAAAAGGSAHYRGRV